MAYLDDRIWCHPKFVGLSALAFASWVKAVAYSSGMGTAGCLDPAQQRLIGATARARTELVQAGLWDANGDGGSVLIHDWDDYNGKRDERRLKDRDRKRKERAQAAGQRADKTRMSAGQEADKSMDVLTIDTRAPDDGMKEVKE